MPNYKKIIVTTSTYSVSDMVEGTQAVCDTKVLSGSSWSFTSNELPATVYYQTTEVENSKTYMFACDEDHVEMATGRTWREEYMSLLKQHGKEVTSTVGAITVNNGIKGRVISGEIKGQTAKNVNSNTNRSFSVTGEPSIYNVGAYLQNNNYYTIIFNQKTISRVGNIDLTADFTFNGSRSLKTNIQDGLTKIYGIVTNIVTPTLRFFANGSQVVMNDIMLLEGDWTNKDISYIPFGLSSTQAVINANGASYPIYEPTIKGTTTGLAPTVVFNPVLPTLVTGDVLDLATKTITFANATTRVLNDDEMKAYSSYKKVILLPFAEDKMTLNEDGSWAWNKTSNKITLNGTEPWEVTTWNNSTDKATVTGYLQKSAYTSVDVNGKLFTTHGEVFSSLFTKDIEGTAITTDSKYSLQITVLKSKLVTPDALGLKAWLQSNPINIIYQQATPIITTLDKSIMPTIQTADKINICQVESPVAPSSLTLTLPTSDNIRKEFAVVLLNGYTKVAGSFTPRVALTQDNRVEISLDVTSPATFYPTIFSIDASIRPSRDIKVNGFVDNISTPITIKTTGEVVLPNTVVSKNVYIKEYYRLGVM